MFERVCLWFSQYVTLMNIEMKMHPAVRARFDNAGTNTNNNNHTNNLQRQQNKTNHAPKSQLRFMDGQLSITSLSSALSTYTSSPYTLSTLLNTDTSITTDA